MEKPNFLGIGGVKCGSTWLAECLRDHPQIFVSSPKELNYFGKKDENTPLEWYLSHFVGSGGYKAVGEFSPGYLMRPSACARIREELGRIKTIVILRNPVDQFLSHVKMYVKNGHFPPVEAFDMDALDRVTAEKHALLTHGKSHDSLEKCLDLFGEENVFVLINEESRKDPKRAVASVYRYLEVDEQFVPYSLNKKVSPGIIPRFQFLETLRRSVYAYLAERNPEAINKIKRMGIAELYRKINNRGDFEVATEALDYLSDYYREDVLKLERLLERDLSCWK